MHVSHPKRCGTTLRPGGNVTVAVAAALPVILAQIRVLVVLAIEVRPLRRMDRSRVDALAKELTAFSSS
jgi:hypothetical protein